MAFGGNYDWLLKARTDAQRASIREMQITAEDAGILDGHGRTLTLDAGIKCPPVKEPKMAEEQTFTLAEIETYLHNVDHTCSDLTQVLRIL